MTAERNAPNLTFYFDFYVLDGLRHLLTGAPMPTDRAYLYEKGIAKLKKDTEQAFETLSNEYSQAILLYLLVAGTGESRYAYRHGAGIYLSEFEYGITRDSAYDKALEYNPLKLARALYEIFNDGQWGGSYGGQPWAKIARACINLLDGTFTPATFIDHAADLEHNGGNCFDKHTEIFNVSRPFSMSNMLNWKFATANPASDFINDGTVIDYYGINSELLTYTTLELLNRYSNIVKGKPLPIPGYFATSDHNRKVIKPNMFDLPATGNRTPYLSYNEPVFCYECNEAIPNDDTYSTDSYPDCLYCSGCFYDLTSTCEKCGDKEFTDDMTPTQDGYYCESCAECLVSCDSCNDYYLEDDITPTANGYNLCESCTRDSDAYTCPICEELFYTYNWDEQNPEACPDCAEKYPMIPCPSCGTPGHHSMTDNYYFNSPVCDTCYSLQDHNQPRLFELIGDCHGYMVQVTWKIQPPAYPDNYNPSFTWYNRFTFERFANLAMLTLQLADLNLDDMRDTIPTIADEALDLFNKWTNRNEKTRRMYAARFAARRLLSAYASRLVAAGLPETNPEIYDRLLNFAIKLCPDG